MRNPINASQDQRPHWDEVWNFLHHSSGVFRHRGVADLCGGWIAVLFNLHAGKNKDGRSAHFIKAVNTRQGGGWILADAVLCFLNKVVALSELRGPSRPDLGTGRRLAADSATSTRTSAGQTRTTPCNSGSQCTSRRRIRLHLLSSYGTRQRGSPTR